MEIAFLLMRNTTNNNPILTITIDEECTEEGSDASTEEGSDASGSDASGVEIGEFV